MSHQRILLPSDPADAFVVSCYLGNDYKATVTDVLHDQNEAFPRDVIKQFFPSARLWSIPPTQEGHRFRFEQNPTLLNLEVVDQENWTFRHPEEIFSRQLARISVPAYPFLVVELDTLTPAERQKAVAYLDNLHTVGLSFTRSDFQHPLILDFSGQFTALQQIELLKQAVGFIGGDSIHGAIAARLFFGKDLRIKSGRFSLTRFYPHQSDHCIRSDLLEIL